jgi:hypothetical protein
MQVDWFTLLLIFFFIILPLLQHLTGKRQQTPPAEVEDEWDDTGASTRSREERHAPQEWDAWAEPEALEPSREARNAWEELGLDDLFREPKPEPRAEPRSEPLPAPERRVESRSQAPRSEPTRIPGGWDDWRVQSPPPAPPPVRAERRVPTSSVSFERAEFDRDADRVRVRRPIVLESPAVVSRREGPRIRHRLRSTHSIREAIVLAEVLGPPRALVGPHDR